MQIPLTTLAVTKDRIGGHACVVLPHRIQIVRINYLFELRITDWDAGISEE